MQILNDLFTRTIKKRNWLDYISNLELQELTSYFGDIEFMKYPFSIVKALYLNGLIDVPTCPVCNNPVKASGGKFFTFCSGKCSKTELGRKIIQKLAEEGCINKFGVSNVNKIIAIRDKIKQTNLEKYGVEYASQADEVKEKIIKTNLEKYGVAHTFQAENVKEQIKKTMLERYNTENYTNTEEYLEKLKATSLKRYGTEFPQQSEEVKEKIKQANIDKFGVDNVFKSDEIKERIKDTNLERYGYENVFASETIKNKIKEYYNTKYGVDYPAQVEKIKNKGEQTRRTLYYDTFLDKLNSKGITPLFNKKEFINTLDTELSFLCKKCNTEFKTYKTNPQKICCPICNYTLAEYNISEWLQSILESSTAIRNNRFEYNNKKLELDIYLPDYNLGIEFHGIYWHSNLYKDRKYHQNKYNHFKNLGIEVIQIFENEWLLKQNIVKSIILNRLGLSENKIMARKCKFKEISNKEYRYFCEDNHLQGYAPAKYRYGLFHKDILVMIMSFSKNRFSKEDSLENIRTCSLLNTNIIGGFAKLLKNSINALPKDTKKIISFIDNRYFTGKSYINNGFSLVDITSPNFFYFKKSSHNLESRIKYQKHKLQTLLYNFDPNLSAKENMLNNDYLWIYDAGNLKLELFIKKTR